MSLGKIKMKVVLFGVKFTFYEYARHTLVESGQQTKWTMDQLISECEPNQSMYFRTKNFYIQLLAAYSASYVCYPHIVQIIPSSHVQEGINEISRGLDEGVKAWKFDGASIEEELVTKYKIAFKRYYSGLLTDINNVKNGSFDPDVLNFYVNTFTELFVVDSVHLMESESKCSINELTKVRLAQVVSQLPITVFNKLAKRSMEYVPN
jgi:hypothetical protein